MENPNVFCIPCKSIKNKKILLKKDDDKFFCPECGNSYFLDGSVLLESYISNWRENAEKNIFLLRPELTPLDLANPKIYFAYLDCYYTLLMGRYNASIIMMGVLVEVIAKTRIYLKTGKEIEGALGTCIKKIVDNNLMDKKDIQFLKLFKNKVRNPYQHVNDKEILRGVEVPVWEIDASNPENIIAQIKAIRERKIPPKMVKASDNPAIRPLIKESYDQQYAIKLFNEVYDFLVLCNNKYFNQKEWDYFHQIS